MNMKIMPANNCFLMKKNYFCNRLQSGGVRFSTG